MCLCSSITVQVIICDVVKFRLKTNLFDIASHYKRLLTLITLTTFLPDESKLFILNYSLQVVGKNNIWSLVARSHQHSPMADLDWAEMEGLFCQQALPAPSLQASPRLGRDVDSDPRRRKESSEVNHTNCFVIR